MLGEEYLSKTNKKRLKSYRTIILNAYNKSFPSLFPLENLEEKDITKVFRKSYLEGDSFTSQCILEISRLKRKAFKAYSWRNPLPISA